MPVKPESLMWIVLRLRLFTVRLCNKIMYLIIGIQTHYLKITQYEKKIIWKDILLKQVPILIQMIFQKLLIFVELM